MITNYFFLSDVECSNNLKYKLVTKDEQEKGKLYKSISSPSDIHGTWYCKLQTGCKTTT